MKTPTSAFRFFFILIVSFSSLETGGWETEDGRQERSASLMRESKMWLSVTHHTVSYTIHSGNYSLYSLSICDVEVTEVNGTDRETSSTFSVTPTLRSLIKASSIARSRLCLSHYHAGSFDGKTRLIPSKKCQLVRSTGIHGIKAGGGNGGELYC